MRKLILSAFLAMLLGCGQANITGLATQEPPSIPQERADTITIGSFNIQVFGRAKRNKPEVMEILGDIATHYDILAIQEVRDSSLETIPVYLQRINNHSTNATSGNQTIGTYRAIASERGGRTSSKEQYAYYYDDSRIDYLNVSYLYPDHDDIFEREPHIAYFQSGTFDFLVINVHIKPDDAHREIAGLEDVIDYAQTRHAEQDIILVGDLNADGSYYDENTKNLGHTWIIPDHYDTTVAQSSNTYDRIIITQSTQEDHIGIVGVHRFDRAYELTAPQALDVSDHYPIWAQFSRTQDTD